MQTEYIDVLPAIYLDAFLSVLHNLLERASVEHGINGFVRDLHIAKTHNARRNTIAFGNLELRFTVKTDAHHVRTVLQVIDFEHFTSWVTAASTPLRGL